MIPDFIDEGFANVLAAIAEGVIGVALLTLKFRAYGGLGFMALMTGFFPIHVWDLLKDEPFIGSKIGAAVRLVLQLLLIYTGWRIYTGNVSQKDVQ
jgi:uncharacterized membrane protein